MTFIEAVEQARKGKVVTRHLISPFNLSHRFTYQIIPPMSSDSKITISRKCGEDSAYEDSVTEYDVFATDWEVDSLNKIDKIRKWWKENRSFVLSLVGIISLIIFLLFTIPIFFYYYGIWLKQWL